MPPRDPCPRTLACYRRLMRLYPPSYRVTYGPMTLQVVRDLCRDMHRTSTATKFTLIRLWLRLLPDFLITLGREHISAWKGKSPMKKWTEPKSLSLHLLLIGLGLGAMSLTFMIMPRLSVGLMHLTAAVFLAKAVAEWYRPHAQWGWSLLNGIVVAVAFGFFLPAWAKFDHMQGMRQTVLPALSMAVLGFNLGVALLKGLIFLWRRFYRHDPSTS